MKRILTSALVVAALLPLSGLAGTYTFSTSNSRLTDMSHGTAVTWALSGQSYTNLFNDINSGGKVVTSATLTLLDIYDWTGETRDPADALFVNILSGLNVGTQGTGIKWKQFDPDTDQTSLSWSVAVNPFVNNTATSNDFNDILQGGYSPLAFNDAVEGSLLKSDASVTKAGTPSTVTWSDPQGGSGSPDFNLVLNFSAANLAVLTALLDADTGTGTPNVGFGFAAECHYYMDGVYLTITTGDAPPPPTHSVPDHGSTLALMGLAISAMAAFRRFKK